MELGRWFRRWLYILGAAVLVEFVLFGLLRLMLPSTSLSTGELATTWALWVLVSLPFGAIWATILVAVWAVVSWFAMKATKQPATEPSRRYRRV